MSTLTYHAVYGSNTCAEETPSLQKSPFLEHPLLMIWNDARRFLLLFDMCHAVIFLHPPRGGGY